MTPLPIDALLPELVATVCRERRLVLVAAPGAGKTTRLPPALAAAGMKRVLVLQPRRVAARAAAARIAAEQGWQVGREVGYQVRFERRAGPETRIELLTEGILTRRLQSDPFLEGVDSVVLDEFHERSLHADLALALLAEVRESRPELHLVVMSATLEALPLARFLQDAPLIEVPARPFPVDVERRAFDDRDERRPLVERVGAAVLRALAQDGGDVLVFLPGAGEIRRCLEQLQTSLEGRDIELLPLHGSLPLEAQQRALSRGSRRRVVLATNVAETSLTIEGVTTVVDSGLVRQLRHDPASGLDRLETVRCSQASATQRAGRAGRTQPGRALQLWSEATHVSLPRHTSPEIRRVDLTRCVLELRAWGTDPHTFRWFEAPEAAALSAAEALLVLLGALREDDRGITERGKRLLELPLHPRLGALLLAAQALGCANEGAALAALLSERDILLTDALYGARAAATQSSGSSDLLARYELLRQAEAAGFRADTLRALGLHGAGSRQVARVRDDLVARLPEPARPGPARGPRTPRDGHLTVKREQALARAVLAGYPDRVARRREAGSPRAVLVGGRGVTLAPESVVREAEFFVAVLLDDRRQRERGGAREAQVRWAVAIDEGWLPTQEVATEHFDATDERVVARSERRYLDLCLAERPHSPDPECAAKLLAQEAARRPERALQLDEPPRTLRARVALLQRAMPELGLPLLDDEALQRLLPALCAGKTSFAELRREALVPWLSGLLSTEQRRLLERHAPERLKVPSGRSHALVYPDDPSAPPVLAVKLQELFGLQETPRIAAGRVAVLLHLLAPNGRPAQVTQDLASFWRQTYAEVRKELRQRYPKHPWPEDPLGAPPTHRTKPRRA